MKKLDFLKKAVVAVAVVMMGVVAMPVPAMAAKLTCSGADCVKDGAGSTSAQNAQDADISAIVKNIINVVLYAIGIIAVFMIIFGGVKYATSSGDTTKVKSAKDTILYAVIGLVVAILAYAIVNWVVGNFTTS